MSVKIGRVKKKTGTLEWAEVNVNFLQVGPSHKWKCRNNCHAYCYARKIALHWGQIDQSTECGDPVIKLPESYPRRKRVMMPSSHDLFPEHLSTICHVLGELLTRDNTVILVSKPRKDVVGVLLPFLRAFKDGKYAGHVEFRFSITSMDNEISRKYEPGASLPGERMECLRMVGDAGFESSVSIEPYLQQPEDIYEMVLQECQGEIWIGAMNHGACPELKYLYTPQNIRRIFDKLGGCNQIMWKDSIQKIMHCDARGRPLS